MLLKRRDFLRPARVPSGGRPAGAALAARGLEASLAAALQQGSALTQPAPPGEIRINSNENPVGPGRKALDAIAGRLIEAGRYPFNSTPSEGDLAATIAALHRIKADHVVLGAGSQEILKNAVRVFTAPGRGLITGSPSFENCVYTAKRLNHPVTEVLVDSSLRLDLDAMLPASQGGGLVYLCNPNNPTATLHGIKAVTDFVERLQRTSPGTTVLIDEAYHDYVNEPSYATAIPLAVEIPNVFVTRTFSKAYGMAGMRIGYAVGRPYTIARLAALKMPYNVSVPGIAAAIAALGDLEHIRQERDRNAEARAFTVAALQELGCQPAESRCNFVFADLRHSAKEFREACAKAHVMVGRDFPPFEKTHARISIGTMDEMRKAVEVFRSVLRSSATATRSQGVS